jgi:hypothetical protein
MQHSPLYPQCDWNSRVVAIQARCLLSQSDLERYGSIVRPEFPAILEVVYRAIQYGFPLNGLDEEKGNRQGQEQGERIRFLPPSLDEILIVEQELQSIWNKERKKFSCSCS